MEAIFRVFWGVLRQRLFLIVVALVVVLSMTGCYTTYDAYGRPVQSVDPAVALLGVAAAGVIGYAIANNNDDHRHQGHGYSNYGYHQPYYGRSYSNYNRGYGNNYCRY